MAQNRLLNWDQPGLLVGFAAGHVLGRFARLDDPGDGFHYPAHVAMGEGADAELLDQHHGFARRVKRQHGDGVAAFEDLADQLAAPTAGVQFVLQAVAVDPEIAVEYGLLGDDFDPILRHAGLHALGGAR
jgi:hypothetical protein